MIVCSIPKIPKVLFASCPKAGSTSLKRWLFHIENGYPWTEAVGDIHAWFDKNQLSSVPRKSAGPWGRDEWPREAGWTVVSVHRHPEDRITSYYRALKQRHGETKSYKEWLEQLHNLRVCDKWARWHTDLQSRFLDLPEHSDIILPLQRMHELPALLSDITGRTYPDISQANKTYEDSPPTAAEQKLLSAYVSLDVAMGWDGQTTKLPNYHER